VGKTDTVGPGAGSFPGVSMAIQTDSTTPQASTTADYTSPWQTAVADGKSLVAGLFTSAFGDDDISTTTTLKKEPVQEPVKTSNKRVKYHPFAPTWVWTWIGFAGLATFLYGITNAKNRLRARTLSSHSRETSFADGSTVESQFEWRSVVDSSTAYRRVPACVEYETF
jgi:hypothetical protein